MSGKTTENKLGLRPHPFYRPRKRVRIKCGKGRTKQDMKDACDIHKILAQFAKTGQLPPNNRVPGYTDLPLAETFHEAMTVIAEANSQFELLPANVRARFKNNAQAFLEFMEDSKNIDEAVALGLATKRDLDDPGAFKDPPKGDRKDPPKEDPAKGTE